MTNIWLYTLNIVFYSGIAVIVGFSIVDVLIQRKQRKQTMTEVQVDKGANILHLVPVVLQRQDEFFSALRIGEKLYVFEKQVFLTAEAALLHSVDIQKHSCSIVEVILLGMGAVEKHL